MAVRVFGSDRVLYGSDYPHTIGDPIGCLARVDRLPDGVRNRSAPATPAHLRVPLARQHLSLCRPVATRVTTRVGAFRTLLSAGRLQHPQANPGTVFAGTCHMPRLRFRVLTVNAHKGFSVFNRRFILRELRDAVNAVSADVVFLQEVIGAHAHHARRYADWPATPQYEYLADTMWKHCYGAMPSTRTATTAMRCCRAFRSAPIRTTMLRSAHSRRAGCCTACSTCRARRRAACDLRAPRTAEAHRGKQMQQLCALIQKEVPPDAPLVVAGDFNDWRQAATCGCDAAA
jgi:endonuclease/exonuclease/phosphatase family metal-dependent hydrolase